MLKNSTPKHRRENAVRNDVMKKWNEQIDWAYNDTVGRAARRIPATEYNTAREFAVDRRKQRYSREYAYKDWLWEINEEFEAWTMDIPPGTSTVEKQGLIQAKYTDAMLRIRKEHDLVRFRPIYRHRMWQETMDAMTDRYKTLMRDLERKLAMGD
jgi:hypothetical protein